MTRRDARDVGCVVFAAIAVMTILLAWVMAVEVFGLAVYAPWRANKQTEITRGTNQYVDTQQTELLGLVRSYDSLEQYEQTEEIDRQQRNLVLQMCEAAGRIQPQFVPESAQDVMTKEGC